MEKRRKMGKRECEAEIEIEEHPIVMSLHRAARPTERHRPRSRRL